MSYFVLFAHLEKALVKKGDILNGQHNVGIIGQSGNSTGKHLHLQVETALPLGYPEIRGFDQFAEPTNPSVVINKYGKMCQNTPTQSYWNYDPSINSIALCGGHHTGIDYSGVIDKDYESKYCYTPANAKCKVIATGSDPLNLPHWGGYGNYVIIEVLGTKEEKMSTEFYYFKYNKYTWPQTVIGKGNVKARAIGDLTCIADTYLYNDFEAHSHRQPCPKGTKFITCGQGKYNKKGYYMHKVIFNSCVVWVCYKKKRS